MLVFIEILDPNTYQFKDPSYWDHITIYSFKGYERVCKSLYYRIVDIQDFIQSISVGYVHPE